jgi:hypothetical protein
MPRLAFIRPPLETVRRLHLRFLLLRPGNPNPNGFHITVLSTLLLFALSKPWQAHHKETLNNGILSLKCLMYSSVAGNSNNVPL